MPRKSCPHLTTIRKGILPLNNTLPSTVTSIWLTSLELHSRLLLAGVRRSLTMDMLTDALRLYNNNEVNMVVSMCGNTHYYRSTMAHMSDTQNSVPMHQRFSGKTTGKKRRVCANSVRDYFVLSDNQQLEAINHSLSELEEEDKKNKARDVQQKERERSKFCFPYIVLCVYSP